MRFEHFKVGAHNAYYEKASDEADMRWHRINAIEKTHNIQTILGDRQVGSILEVGCGAGTVLSELSRRGVGASHEGIDVLDPGLNGGPEAPGVKISRYDGETLPYPDGAFDFVYSSHVIEHVLNPRAFIKEVARVSRHLLYFEIPCEMNGRTSHHLIQRALDIGHINYFSPDSFLLLLQTSEQTVKDLRVFPHDLDFYRQTGSALTAPIKMMVKNGLLAANWRLATRVFTYHCGALIERNTPSG